MPPCPDSVLTSAGYLLLKAGHYVGQRVRRGADPLGLTAREFLVLGFVGSADGLSQQELSARLGLDPTIVVGLVDALEERRSDDARTRDPADRRRNMLGLTAAGTALHEEAVAAAGAAEAAFLEPLSQAQRTELRRLLHVVMAPRLPWLA